MQSQVDFCVLIIDRRPGQVEPARELFSFSTELETLQALLVYLLATLRLVVSLGVSTWDWLFVGWVADWQMICQATRLLFFPKGTGYYGLAT